MQFQQTKLIEHFILQITWKITSVKDCCMSRYTLYTVVFVQYMYISVLYSLYLLIHSIHEYSVYNSVQWILILHYTGIMKYSWDFLLHSCWVMSQILASTVCQCMTLDSICDWMQLQPRHFIWNLRVMAELHHVLTHFLASWTSVVPHLATAACCSGCDNLWLISTR